MFTKRKTLIYLFSLIFALLLGWLFFQIITRMILCKTVSETINELEEMIRQSPVYILSETLSDEQGNTAEADISMTDTPVGDIHLNMKVLVRNQNLMTSGTMRKSEDKTDFSVYLDQNTLAVSSDLLNEGYYGITFDTFMEDLRRIPMLSWIINENTAKVWDDSIQNLRKKLTKPRSVPDLTNLDAFHETDLTGLLMVMPVQINRTELIQNGATVPVMRMVYEFRADRLPESIKAFFTPYALANMEVTASFYLQKQEFVMAEIQLQNGKKVTNMLIEKNITASTETTNLSLLLNGAGEQQETSIAFECGEIRKEQWNFSDTQNAMRSVSILWDHKSGEMILSDDEEAFALVFQERENGFAFQSEDFRCLLEMFGFENSMKSSWKAVGSVTVTKGGNPRKPEYKNLDQWSFEDFLILLDGIGSLIGWKLS